jgi:tungstate transport system substrate-binding protein
MSTKKVFPLLLTCLILFSRPVIAEQVRLKMATTTSTENSGLLAILNPPFEEKHGIKLDVISVGTGKAIRLGKNGDVDLIFVHATEAEKKIVEGGSGIEREPVMHNDFVIVGPVDDPAGIKQAKNINEAMTRLLQAKSIFVSRGDDSGTHKKEKSLWRMVGSEPAGDRYLAVGQGMGVVLRIADDKEAYTLTDRGTYLAYKDKMKLRIVFENDAALFNPYHVIMVNPVKHPHTKIDLARKYSAFIRSEAGQALIRNFKAHGEVLFHPDVIK